MQISVFSFEPPLEYVLFESCAKFEFLVFFPFACAMSLKDWRYITINVAQTDLLAISESGEMGLCRVSVIPPNNICICGITTGLIHRTFKPGVGIEFINIYIKGRRF